MDVYLNATVINHDIYFIVRMSQSGLSQFRVVILEDFPSVPTVISPLNHVDTLYNSRFIHLQNINTASQRICVFHTWFISKVLQTIRFLFKNDFVLRNAFTGLQCNKIIIYL